MKQPEGYQWQRALDLFLFTHQLLACRPARGRLQRNLGHRLWHFDRGGRAGHTPRPWQGLSARAVDVVVLRAQ